MLHEREDAVLRFVARPRPVRLEGKIRHYAWGGYTYLAELIGAEAADARPWAELWAGAHPAGPATAMIDRVRVPLDELVARAPEAVLGAKCLAKFGPELPYLLKVLDVRAMLSIQAHPTREQAREGCAREDAAQIPRSAPDRSYRDANHKPEAQVALTDFWLLYGFRPIGEIRQLLDERGAGSAVRAFVEGHAAEPERLRGLYTFLMGLSQPEVDALIGPLVQKASALAADGRLELSSPDYWVARAAREFPLPAGHYDRGILAIYLLNLVHLRPGEGTFIGPGVLHAYLSGVAVEVMASSDNVLRGGLTPKHVDVAELLRILRFDRASPRVTAGVAASAIEREYRTPAEEFDLAGLVLEGGQRLQRVARAAETLLVTGGAAHLRAGDDELTLPRGAIALVPAGLGYTLAGVPGATLFRASVPGL